MKKLGKLILVLIGCFALGLALSYFTSNGETKQLNDLIQNENTIIPVVLGGGLYLLYILNHLDDKKDKGKLTSKSKDGKEI